MGKYKELKGFPNGSTTRHFRKDGAILLETQGEIQKGPKKRWFK